MIQKKIMVSLLSIILWLPSVSCNAAVRGNAKTEEVNDTVAELVEKATKGDALAQNTLGVWYYTGKNVDQNYKTALEWWAKSAQQNNADAIGNMALCYQLGNGATKDSIMATELYFRAIEKGNEGIIPQHEAIVTSTGSLFSSRLLYECYRRGIGVKRDGEKATFYLEKLAEGGDTDSQYILALQYLNDKRPAEAAKWFKASAENGKVGGIYYYGYMLYNGMGVGQDKERGIALMQQAADRGFAAAHRDLGLIYYGGDNVEQDYEKAVEHLKKAAGSNDQAAWVLGLCYLNGSGVKQDYYFATQWIAESAKSHAKELNSLIDEYKGTDYYTYLIGLKKYYVEKEYDAAIKLFKKVKNVEGLTMLAVCQANKNYEKRNTKKAAKNLEKAVAKGSVVANYYLASMYEAGEGVDKDKDKSFELLKIAADDGVAYAQCKLGDMYFSGDGVAQDFTQAVKYYLAAEAQNRLTPTSAKYLITCYERQISALPDLNEAEKRIEELKKINDKNKLTILLSAIND